jgi:ribosome biogenesis GTPase
VTAESSGLVVGAYRRRFEVELDDRSTLLCTVKGRSLAPACGDAVEVSLHGERDGVITAIGPRRSVLARQDAWRQKTVAANVDTVIGVVAVDPPYNPELLDRWTVAAEAVEARFVLVLNKVDLPGAAEARARLDPYARLGYDVVALHAKRGIEPLRAHLEKRHAVLIGQSGMGKSTIINAATGEERAKTGEVSVALKAGTHTTTHARLHRLGGDAWIVDSPGMQAFGLNQLDPHGLELAFVEFRAHLGQCRFRNCQHDQEPGCAIRAAVEDGRIAESRYAVYRRIRTEIAAREGAKA